MPGLVDAHCHVGLDAGGAASTTASHRAAGARRPRRRARCCSATAGSPADTRWSTTTSDLPRLIRAGRHIAAPRRYIRDYAHEVEPADLVADGPRSRPGAATAGSSWSATGSTATRATWRRRGRPTRSPPPSPPPTRRAPGSRRTCFGNDALPGLIAAGIDCIEHGTGLTEDLIDEMAARGTALVPTLVQLDNFPELRRGRAEQKFPAYAEHMRRPARAVRRGRRRPTRPGCRSTPAPTPAAASPHGVIAGEVRALHAAGLPAEDALAAASGGPGSGSGCPASSEGAPADFVVYDADPRADLDTLRRPQRMVLRGVVVG